MGSAERLKSSTEEMFALPVKESSALASVQSLDSWMIEMLDAVNNERNKAGAPPLCYNQKIINAAYKHNEDMADKNYFSHTGKDGSSPGDRITRENYSWCSYGENIAKGQ